MQYFVFFDKPNNIFMEEKTIKEVLNSIIFANLKGLSIQSVVSYQMVYEILDKVEDIFQKEPILLEIEPPVHVVGDIHGNYDDLLRIFDQKGYPPQEKYLFLGDYVDRGKYGVEVMIHLFCLKLLFPDKIYLLRGNHECVNISMNYGFYEEVCSKYVNGALFYQFHSVFKGLPIAVIIGRKIICLHGGISPEFTSLEEFRKKEKPTDIDLPSQKIFQDILWGDPRDDEEEFKPNNRGLGFFFNSKALDRFLDDNNLQLLIRSHELCSDGYEYPYKEDDSCITVFSNTDYCSKANKASVIDVLGDLSIYVWTFAPLKKGDLRKKKHLLPLWLLTPKTKPVIPILNVASVPVNQVLKAVC